MALGKDTKTVHALVWELYFMRLFSGVRTEILHYLYVFFVFIIFIAVTV